MRETEHQLGRCVRANVLAFTSWSSAIVLELDDVLAVVYNEKFQSDVLTLRAEVAELADAQASGACGRKVVKVQILSSAPSINSTT
jgi:hypothetical protein